MAIFVGNGHYFDPLPAPVISLFDTAMLRRFSSGRVRFWHCRSGGFPRPAGGERSDLLPGPPDGRKPHTLPSAPGTGGNRHRLFVHRQLPDPSLLYRRGSSDVRNASVECDRYRRGPSDVRKASSDVIGTGKPLLLYEIRLRGTG